MLYSKTVSAATYSTVQETCKKIEILRCRGFHGVWTENNT